jgi:hypothetical protein
VKPFCALCLLLMILCVSTLAVAQSTDATISGSVVDSSGRVITDADIQILNEATGVQYTNKSNGAGIYTVSILPPGQYRVQVSKAGFKTLIKPGIFLNVQSAVAVNFTMPLGAASESITVEAGTSLINTTDASVGTVIDRKFVANIPLNGRSFQDLISMTPGVVTQSPQSGSGLAYSGDFSVNGQRTESNYYTVDGVTGNINSGNGNGLNTAASSGSLGGSTALGTTQSLISVDALQEFRVQSSTYSAEYGRSPGGQFSFATRSGSNNFHGSMFDYLRNNFFDANDWFNDHYAVPAPALRQNDFGGTIGGPIRIPELYDGKNKMFFFVSYEGLRLTQPQAATVQYVPDMSLRQQAPSALRPILNAFPLPNGLDYGNPTTPSLAQFISGYSAPSSINSTNVRFDANLIPGTSFFFRYGYTPSSTSFRQYFALDDTEINTQTYTLGATSRISGSLNNELRLGYDRANSAAILTINSFGGATPINLGGALGGGPSGENLMELNFTGIGSPGILTSDANNLSRQWNFVDTVSLSSHQHQFRMGVDYRRIKAPTEPASPLFEGLYYSAQAILDNSATIALVEQRLSATPIFNETAVFGQDEWRISSRLNLSLGLRWELNPPPTEAHGNDAYTLSGNLSDPTSLALAPRGTPLWKTTRFNFAPRLGIAYTVHSTPGWETVLRTGGGVFFDTDNELATLGYGGVGFLAYHEYLGTPLPTTPAQVDFSPSIVPPYTSSTIYAFPTHLQLPYTLEWNVSAEQAMTRSQSVTLSYVGSNGRRLLAQQLLSLGSLNPEFGYIYYVPNGITSNYQALQAKFQRTIARGVQALASYSWSHSIDYGSNASALPITRADSDFDVRHNFQGGVSWDIPGRDNRWLMRYVLSGWGIDARGMARTGFPVSLNGSQLTDPASGSEYYSGVDLVQKQPLYLYGSQYPGGRIINKAAFSVPSGSMAGDAPRNLVRGFGATQINMAARREFKLSDVLGLQFRAEAFNILNHPNFGYIDSTLTDAQFGQATQMLNQSLGSVASQYQQGGPRSMQFALKLLF